MSRQRVRECLERRRARLAAAANPLPNLDRPWPAADVPEAMADNNEQPQRISGHGSVALGNGNHLIKSPLDLRSSAQDPGFDGSPDSAHFGDFSEPSAFQSIFESDSDDDDDTDPFQTYNAARLYELDAVSIPAFAEPGVAPLMINGVRRSGYNDTSTFELLQVDYMVDDWLDTAYPCDDSCDDNSDTDQPPEISVVDDWLDTADAWNSLTIGANAAQVMIKDDYFRKTAGLTPSETSALLDSMTEDMTPTETSKILDNMHSDTSAHLTMHTSASAPMEDLTDSSWSWPVPSWRLNRRASFSSPCCRHPVNPY
ncbi:hypothetical protein GE09DRAFT_585971 [Coniochaeta sp. 2T2.1]|nr:hypothetical protein GE09DRAFT_585971 [Coniochaeta sp. 2T2.1]